MVMLMVMHRAGGLIGIVVMPDYRVPCVSVGAVVVSSGGNWDVTEQAVFVEPGVAERQRRARGEYANEIDEGDKAPHQQSFGPG